MKIWLWGFEEGWKPPFTLLLSLKSTKCDASLQGSDSLMVGERDTKWGSKQLDKDVKECYARDGWGHMIENNEEGQGGDIGEGIWRRWAQAHKEQRSRCVSRCNNMWARGGSRWAIALSVGNHGWIVEAREEKEPHPRDHTKGFMFCAPRNGKPPKGLKGWTYPFFS